MANTTSATRQAQRDLSQDQARTLLRSHFEAHTGDAYKDGWDKLWKGGDLLPWDRMVPSPALLDTLDNHKNVVGTSAISQDGTSKRKRALVPGCGRGVDVMLLQAYGYDVVGLDISETAVEACEKYAKQTENDELYKARDEKLGKGSRKFVQGDFYADEWLKKAGISETQGCFELIYDYTFFCAMHPTMRPAWAKRTSSLLADNPQANLICLEFPTTKPANTGGPPFSSPPKAYMEHLSHPGVEIAYTADGEVKRDPFAESDPGALERVAHFIPSDTHAAGKGADGSINDYISVWRHR